MSKRARFPNHFLYVIGTVILSACFVHQIYLPWIIESRERAKLYGWVDLIQYIGDEFKLKEGINHKSPLSGLEK